MNSFIRLLLDENLPKRLKQDFPNHEVYTARDIGWNGIKNGELLSRMLAHIFHALLTFDKKHTAPTKFFEIYYYFLCGECAYQHL